MTFETFEKLVRDYMPEREGMPRDPIALRKVKDQNEHVMRLLYKLREERKEFKDATTTEDRMEEAADVLEVYDTLIRLGKTYQYRTIFLKKLQNSGLDIDQVLNIQQEKRNKKGGFDQGTVGIFLEK